MFSWVCSKCGRTVWNCKTCKCGNTYKDIRPNKLTEVEEENV